MSSSRVQTVSYSSFYLEDNKYAHKYWLDDTQEEKGRGDEEEKEEKGEGNEGTRETGDGKGGFSPLRSLWQESSGISRGLVVNQNLNPPREEDQEEVTQQMQQWKPPILRSWLWAKGLTVGGAGTEYSTQTSDFFWEKHKEGGGRRV